MRKNLVVLSIVAVFVVLAAAASPIPQPTEADFIPKDAVVYFDGARGRQYWGQEADGWRIAIGSMPKELRYVESSGYAEVVSVPITVFNEDGDWQHWAEFGDLRIAVTITSTHEGHRPIVTTRTLHRQGMSANRFGTWWRFRTSVDLNSIRAIWGSLPEAIRVSVELTHPKLPSPKSAEPLLALRGMKLKDANWWQKTASLRLGMDSSDVTRILGIPKTKTTLKSGIRLWTYNNPLAAKGLPENMRKTRIRFDANGKVIRLFDIFFGC